MANSGQSWCTARGNRTGRPRGALYALSRAPVSAAANACAVAERADLAAVSIEAANAITADGVPEPAAARAPRPRR